MLFRGTIMGEFYIFGAGEHFCAPPPFEKDDFILAADGGFKYLSGYGIRPTMTMGDFDSLGGAPEGENVIRLPVEKDDTDTGAAIKLGLQKGFRVFHIYGGTGGRLDHTLANIQHLAFLAGEGARGYLYGDGIAVTAIKNDRLVFPRGLSGTVSVFSFTESCTGVTERGLKYGLEDAVLESRWPLGVSNSFTGEEAEIAVKEGILIVIYPQTAA